MCASIEATLVMLIGRKASAVEHMVVDALLAAEPVVRLIEKTEDSREFAKLDDTILRVRTCCPQTFFECHAMPLCSTCFGNLPAHWG